MDAKTLSFVLRVQRKELTDHAIYRRLANHTKNKNNRTVLSQVAFDELTHYHFWKAITRKSLTPNYFKVYWYMFLSNVFGLSFGLKMMERGEVGDREVYGKLRLKFPKVSKILEDEEKHEKSMYSMLQEEKLIYANYVMLGLSDGLVEFTGILAGLTFALQNNLLVAMTGLIAGFAASLSMASSAYLSSREDQDNTKSPIKAALYTGIAYILAILFMITPYLFIRHYLLAFVLMLTAVVGIIASFTYYISFVKGQSFTKRFSEMFFISMSVALISFCIGWVLRVWIGVTV